MKHIKKYKLFESTSQIDQICKEYGIKNYTINPDGIVDVDGDVYLSYKKLDKLPVRFGKVTGDFWCNNNQLTTLEGCPQTVVGSFLCYNNQLTSLEGCPQTVGAHFSCHSNKLTSLEGCPQTVGAHFSCRSNKLTSLEGCPQTVGAHFSCHSNKLTSLEGCPTDVGGDFWCNDNQLTTLEGLTDVSIGGNFHYHSNPIHSVTSNWLINVERPDMNLIELFNDIQPIVGDKLYLSKLEYFHDDIRKPLPDLDKVKKYYEIIE
jgi:hypothetical protein